MDVFHDEPSGCQSLNDVAEVGFGFAVVLAGTGYAVEHAGAVGVGLEGRGPASSGQRWGASLVAPYPQLTRRSLRRRIREDELNLRQFTLR
jgi:hypothetical protein